VLRGTYPKREWTNVYITPRAAVQVGRSDKQDAIGLKVVPEPSRPPDCARFAAGQRRASSGRS
jgi:hypothetical protein